MTPDPPAIGPVLPYEARVPDRGVRLVRHHDGISIHFRQGVGYAFWVLAERAGIVGCLFLLFVPPILAVAMVGRGPGSLAVYVVMVGWAVALFAGWTFLGRQFTPRLSVRNGQVHYTIPNPRLIGSDTRDCWASDVVSVEPGTSRPVIRLRGGNELLGGIDAIVVPGYASLSTEGRRWVAATVRRAVGLPEPVATCLPEADSHNQSP